MPYPDETKLNVLDSAPSLLTLPGLPGQISPCLIMPFPDSASPFMFGLAQSRLPFHITPCFTRKTTHYHFNPRHACPTPPHQNGPCHLVPDRTTARRACLPCRITPERIAPHHLRTSCPCLACLSETRLSISILPILALPIDVAYFPEAHPDEHADEFQ